MTYFLVFTYASIFGSFYAVLATDPTLSGLVRRSKCDACGRKLKALDLIPILSYLSLKGRCGTCRSKIPFVYFLAEMFMGLLACLAFYRQGWSIGFLFECLIYSLLVILSLSDIFYLRVPNVLLLVFTPLLIYLSPLTWQGMGLGFAVSFFVLFLTFSLSKGMGLGDVKLFLVLGLVLGYQANLLIMGLASFLATGYFLVSREQKLPFVPFIFIATVLASFLTPIFH